MLSGNLMTQFNMRIDEHRLCIVLDASAGWIRVLTYSGRLTFATVDSSLECVWQA
jgi:hypothetical protein